MRRRSPRAWVPSSPARLRTGGAVASAACAMLLFAPRLAVADPAGWQGEVIERPVAAPDPPASSGAPGYSIETSHGQRAPIAIVGEGAPAATPPGASVPSSPREVRPGDTGPHLRPPAAPIPVRTPVPVLVDIRCAVGRPGSLRAADRLARTLRGAGYAVETPHRVRDPGAGTVVFYHYDEDRTAAREVGALMPGAVAVDRLPENGVADPRPGLIEINLAG